MKPGSAIAEPTDLASYSLAASSRIPKRPFPTSLGPTGTCRSPGDFPSSAHVLSASLLVGSQAEGLLNITEVQNCTWPRVSDFHLEPVGKETSQLPAMSPSWQPGHFCMATVPGWATPANSPVTTGSADKESGGSPLWSVESNEVSSQQGTVASLQQRRLGNSWDTWSSPGM